MGEGEEKGFEFGVAFVLWSGGSESSSPLDLDIVKEEEDFGERERFTRRREDKSRRVLFFLSEFEFAFFITLNKVSLGFTQGNLDRPRQITINIKKN